LTRFWDWALEAYARPGVEPACLALQDVHRQSVPYLLWAAWAAREGRVLAATTLQDGAALAQVWTTASIGPLRAARRSLKAPVPGLADDEREAFRGQVKALELQAERLLMAALDALTPPAGAQDAPPALEAALAAASAVWTPPAPPGSLASLADALG
jgi:uncharacterized protein (TIGR02444 family)